MDLRRHNSLDTLLLQHQHLKHGYIILFPWNELYVKTLNFFGHK